MSKKTNFEQVPLYVVKKVLEEQAQQEGNTEIKPRDQERKANAVGRTSFVRKLANGKGGKS